MNSKRILAVALAGLFSISFAGAALAQYGNGGASGSATMRGAGSQARTNMATTRPADSQRRDGTFLSTGTTANGSTTRPSHGNGVQDGSGLNTAQ